MTEPLRSETLARFLAGDASEEERRAVEAWAESDPTHLAELDQLRAAWTMPPPGQWDVDHAWSRVAARLEEAVADPVRAGRRVSRKGFALALAAGLALAFGALLVWQARSSSVDLPLYVATASGEQHAVLLPDGTRITVAPGSELRVGKAYGQGERRVDLTGEAWFEVQHDASRPFRVHAAGTITEDLGTEFGVRAIPGEQAVRVVVESGSASLRREGLALAEGTTIAAREVATLSAADLTVVVARGGEVGALVAWREGRVIFEDSPMDSVASELSRWYGVTFEIVGPDLGNRRLTATFRTDRLDDALQVLELSLGVEASRQGNVVRLTARP